MDVPGSTTGTTPSDKSSPGSISFDEWHTLRAKYDKWGKIRKHKRLEHYFNPEWPPYITAAEIPDRISYIMTKRQEYVKDKRILLYKTSDPTDHRALPYVVRGTEEYERRLRKRLDAIEDGWRKRGTMRCTMITIAPRAIGSVYALHTQIKGLWPRFMDWMRKRSPLTRMIWAVEPTERHYTHYHLVISGSHTKGPWAQAILKWWQDHGVDIDQPGVEVTTDREVGYPNDPIGYASKYLRKTCRDLFWMGLMMLDNRRWWGATVGLGRGGVVETNSAGKWTYCGVCERKWFIEQRKYLVWGDVLPQKIADDLQKIISDRDKYYNDVY